MIWTQNLSVGVSTIDNQHKIWFDKANALFEACNQGKGKTYISELLDFLDTYTKTHFRDEEAYMLKLNYPRYQIQKSLHTVFIRQLDDLRKSFDASGGNLGIVVNANKLILDWFSNHISLEDKQIGEYVRNQK